MGLGFLEILIIATAALVLLGPTRLPSLMRQCARVYVQLRRTSNDFKSAFDHIVREVEVELSSDSERPKSVGHDKVHGQTQLEPTEGYASNNSMKRPAGPVDWDLPKGQ